MSPGESLSISAFGKLPGGLSGSLPLTDPDQALARIRASEAFKQLAPATQQLIEAFCARRETPAQLRNVQLLAGVLAEAIALLPEKGLNEILVANDEGLTARLNHKLEDALIAGPADLAASPALKLHLQRSGAQDTVLRAAEALIVSAEPAALERAGRLLATPTFFPPAQATQQQRLLLQLATQKASLRLEAELDGGCRDPYQLVLLNDQWLDLDKRLDALQKKSPEPEAVRRLQTEVRTRALETRLYLARDIQAQPERLQELGRLQLAYGQSLILSRDQTMGRIEALTEQVGLIEASLQNNPALAAITREYGELESRLTALQSQIEADYAAYGQADAAARPAIDTRLAGRKAELLAGLDQKEALAGRIQARLAATPEVKADYQQLFRLRRELAQAQAKFARLGHLSAEAGSLGDAASLARALDARKQESLKISFSEGMSYTSIRTALGALLTRKADKSALTAEMRLGASVFMVGDVYFLGGMKLEAESDDDGRVVLSFAGYGGVGARVQTPAAGARAQGAVGVKTEYVFDNLDDAARFVLASMNKYDPAFLDFVQDVKAPVQGRLPAPNIYTCDAYKVIPVVVDGGASIAGHEVKATVNYEKLLYQASGKYYESKLDIMAEGGGLGVTLTLEWEQHPDGVELKTTPHYGSALEIKVDLASFSGKAKSTTALTDAVIKALEAGKDKFSLTPELVRNLRAMIQTSADQAVAQAQQQLGRVQAPASVKTRTDVKTFSVEGELSSKLLFRFPFTRDLQGDLQLHAPQLGLDNRCTLSVDGRIPIGGPFSVLAGFEVKAEMRKMLSTGRVRSGPDG